jgi:hypothetical protein
MHSLLLWFLLRQSRVHVNPLVDAVHHRVGHPLLHKQAVVELCLDKLIPAACVRAWKGVMLVNII